MCNRLPVRLLFALIVAFVAFGNWQSALAQSQPPSDSAEVKETTEQFLKAFINLNWERFSGFFAADATVFFPPSARFPGRANNKRELEAVFRTVFENARKQKSSPPYLDIEPKDLKIQMLGDMAIVTFHLEDPDSTGRRTIVLQKQGERWLIVHLHASNIPVAKSSSLD